MTSKRQPLSLLDPTPDYHLQCFRRQLARDAALVQVMSLQPRVEPEYEPSYEQFGEEQQGYHGDRR